jgi:S1-C subfamily serine protease
MNEFDPHGDPKGTPQGDPQGDAGYPNPWARPGYPPVSGQLGQIGDPAQPGHPYQAGTYRSAPYQGHQFPPYDATRQFYGQQQPGWQSDERWPQPEQYQKPRGGPLRTIGFALAAIGLSVLIGLGIGRFAFNQTPAGNTASSGSSVSPGQGSSPNTPGGTSSTSLNPTAIAAKVDPGLVDVNTVLSYQNAEAAGTGIVLTSNGEVLTNNHVVEGATSIKVTDIGNGRTYNATVVGYDRSHDIAVLKLVGASGLATEQIGDSSKVSAGDAVVGIGNAGGAGGTPSTAPGTVVALDQQITASDASTSSSEQLSGLIQVNANIQAGDSGGPLANSAGQVIGVDTAASTGYQFRGGSNTDGAHQGFAIPINQALTIANQITTGKASTTVHIGKSAFLAVEVGGSGSQAGTGTSGAAIVQLLPDSPLANLGITSGDTITSLNGQTVDSATTLTNLMDTHHPGDRLTLTWQDATGQSHTGTVVPIIGPVG